MAWAEDPSNVDPSALRPRLRLLRRDRDGAGVATAALVAAAAEDGQQRAREDSCISACLADRVSLRPEGFCLLSQGQPHSDRGIDPRVLAAVLQAIAGAPFPPPTRSTTALAAAPRPATLAGTRLLPAGRLGPGLLVVREAAAMASPVPALPGAVWDGRFRLGAETRVPSGAMLGALGTDAAWLRRSSPLHRTHWLPAVVLQTLPAVRLDGRLLAVPHLRYPDASVCATIPLMFSPPRPAAAAPFLGANAIGDA
jgi:tRNA(Ile)-lysidine synthase